MRVQNGEYTSQVTPLRPILHINPHSHFHTPLNQPMLSGGISPILAPSSALPGSRVMFPGIRAKPLSTRYEWMKPY